MAPDSSTDAPPDASPDTDTIALAHAPADAAPDASADTCTLALADGAADASAKPSAVAAALYVATDAEPVALAVSETRKSDGVARLCSNATTIPGADARAVATADVQSHGAARLLLRHVRNNRLHKHHRTMRCLYGGFRLSDLQ